MALSLEDRILFIKGLQSPSTEQALLLRLHESEKRTPTEDKLLQALIRAESARERSEKAKAAAAQHLRAEQNPMMTERSTRKTAMLKARQGRLIRLGALVDLAGLQEQSYEALLGLLLAGKEVTDKEKWDKWRQNGGALLAGSNGTPASSTPKDDLLAP